MSGRRRTGAIAFWTVTDQFLSSGTNAALSIVVARSLDPQGFGAFSIAFLVYSFAVGTARATVTDPLIVGYSASSALELRSAGRQAAGATLCIGTAAALVILATAVAARGLAGALVGLALILPGLLVQDCWRQYFFAAGQPRNAALNDGTWALIQLVFLAILLAYDQRSVLTFVLAWGGAGTLAAAFGAWQSGVLPGPRAGVRWLRAQWKLGSALGSSYVINMLAVNGVMFILGAVGGLASVASVRAAQVLLGPVQMLFPTIAAIALPAMARRAAQSRPLSAPAQSLSAVAAAVAAIWLLTLMLIPAQFGRELLGESWPGAREVLPAVGATIILVGAAVGANLAMKAMSLGKQVLQATTVLAVLILLLGTLGATLDAAPGAATGIASAHVGWLLLLWILLHRANAQATGR